MSEHKQGSDDREKNARDRGRVRSGDESPAPPSLPSNFRPAFSDPQERTHVVSALKKTLASSATVEQWMSMLEESWTKHDEQKAQLIDQESQIAGLRDSIAALEEKFEFRRQEIREHEIHGESERLEVARDVMECSEAIVALAQDLELDFPAHTIKPPLARHLKSDKALEKYLDRAQGELEEHVDALWAKIRMMVYGDETGTSSERVIPLTRARQVGCEDTLTRIEALSHRVLYYVDTVHAISKRRDTLASYRKQQNKIREKIQSKQEQCAALEDVRRQLCTESEETLRLQHDAVQKITEHLGTLCEDLSVVVAAVKNSPSLFAVDSEDWELVLERIKTDIVTKPASLEVDTFLGFAAGAIKEVRAIIACIDLVEDLGVFGRCQNPIASLAANSPQRGAHPRVSGEIFEGAGIKLGQHQDHPDFASKIREGIGLRLTGQGSLHLRWILNRDLEQLLLIDESSFQKPWTRRDFRQNLKDRGTIGWIAEVGAEIAGFMIYQLDRAELDILRIAVAPEYRRQGIGLSMLNRLFDKDRSRERIKVRVQEYDLDSQKFLRACGFRALPSHSVKDCATGEPSYLFTAELAEIKAIRNK